MQNTDKLDKIYVDATVFVIEANKSCRHSSGLFLEVLSCFVSESIEKESATFEEMYGNSERITELVSRSV